MTGKTLFDFFYPLIRILVYCSRIVPIQILNLVWSMMDLSPGLTGVLVRYVILASKARACGRNVYIGRNVLIKNLKNLKIGSNTSIHEYTFLDATGGIDIGDNVSIAHHSTIMSTSHSYKDKNIPIKYNPVQKQKVVIENDVWICAAVRILAGVTIKNRCIIGTNSVVNKDCESNSIYAGSPAEIVRKI
jgi:acetyltransferase-like isoleucine patch superfamily enzyme